MPQSQPLTLFDKIWKAHAVCELDGQSLLYIDLHLVHEVTSPQAFTGLREKGRRVRRPDLTIATVDHNVPTEPGRRVIVDVTAATQVQALRRNCEEYGVRFFDMHSPDQGIVHVIGPELGLTQPGMTIVCGDSHTSTHGAFGALAFGIGTSEVEHVLATQCLRQQKPKTMNVRVDNTLRIGTSAKDLALAMVRAIGTDGGAGHVLEYSGRAVQALSMEGRMTLCNMSIEAGARAGMIAPDALTFDYLQNRPFAPANPAWDEAVKSWSALQSEDGAGFDRSVVLDAATIAPHVTWGTSPSMVAAVSDRIPDPHDLNSEAERVAAARALEYMGLRPGTAIEDIAVDRVFIGSCTNSRIEDLREAARVMQGYKASSRVRAMVVPGSQRVKAQAEREGLHHLFINAGFEWREPGCSMCLGMNADILQPGERCASTSNRNFEGRQGKGGRTHLVSPAMAAAAAVHGHFVDVRAWNFKG